VTVTIVTDGSATAAALREWLAVPGVTFIEALNPNDVAVIVGARRAAKLSERLVTVSQLPGGADVSASEALEVAERWLADLTPIDRRRRGAEVIDKKMADGSEGADALQALASLLVPRRARVARGRGRPNGSDPFRGLGLEVVVSLLLHTSTPFTERALAARIGRSQFGVHRVLAELERRGYLYRSRQGSLPRDPLILRDDLVAAWRGRVTPSREASAYQSRDRRSALNELASAAKRHGRDLRLAGPSAVTGPEASADGPLVVYLEGAPDPVMETIGFPRLRSGDVVVWPIVESAVLLEPRTIEDVAATNRVITYADLVMIGSDRSTEAALAVWNQP